MHFVSAHVFHDFVKNLADEDYSSGWSCVLHDIRRLFSSRCEIASYKEREKKGAD